MTITEPPEIEMTVCTLCVDGLATAVCAIADKSFDRDAQAALRDALFETWRFGGGDLMQLLGRNITARRPTKREWKEWQEAADATGKPYLVLNEVRGVA
jgi:hypothetical protein